MRLVIDGVGTASRGRLLARTQDEGAVGFCVEDEDAARVVTGRRDPPQRLPDAPLGTLGPMTVHERPFGRYFEDFEPGDVYKHWPGKTITEADDHLFCMITMNHHPLHTDAWYAETQTQFGKNVVVGNLVYSLVLGMSVPDVSGAAIANLEVETLQHKRPTFHGDTIYAETKVLEKQESSSKPDRGVVTVETRGFNQRGEEVCYFRRKVMVPKRDAPRSRGSGRTRRPSERRDDRGGTAAASSATSSPGDVAARLRARHRRGRRVPRPPPAVPGPHARRAARTTSRPCATSTTRLGTPLFAQVQRRRGRGAGRDAGAEGTFVAMNNVVSQSVPHLARARRAPQPQGRPAGLLLAPHQVRRRRPRCRRSPADRDARAATM